MMTFLLSRAGGILLGAVALMGFTVFAINTAYRAGRDASEPQPLPIQSRSCAKGAPSMTRHATWIAVLCVPLLAGASCQTTAPASECDGWQKLSPSADTRSFIIANDRPFAEGVAAHNTFGNRQGCW